jgi:hypothetical protein
MHKITPTQHSLNRSLDAKIGTSFDTSVNPDVLAQLLADKRSLNTRRAYERDVAQFFKFMTGKEVTPDLVLEFLHLERTQAVSVVLKYKASLIQKGLKEATVNRRLAAIKSLCRWGEGSEFASTVWKMYLGRRYRSIGILPELMLKHSSECWQCAIAPLSKVDGIMRCLGCFGGTHCDGTR